MLVLCVAVPVGYLDDMAGRGVVYARLLRLEPIATCGIVSFLQVPSLSTGTGFGLDKADTSTAPWLPHRAARSLPHLVGYTCGGGG